MVDKGGGAACACKGCWTRQPMHLCTQGLRCTVGKRPCTCVPCRHVHPLLPPKHTPTATHANTHTRAHTHVPIRTATPPHIRQHKYTPWVRQDMLTPTRTCLSVQAPARARLHESPLLSPPPTATHLRLEVGAREGQARLRTAQACNLCKRA